ERLRERRRLRVPLGHRAAGAGDPRGDGLWAAGGSRPLGADNGAGHRRGGRADLRFRGRGEPGRGADPARRIRSARTYPLRRLSRGGAVLLGERSGGPAELRRDGDLAARTRTAPVILVARRPPAAVPTEWPAPLRPVVPEGVRRWARPATA